MRNNSDRYFKFGGMLLMAVILLFYPASAKADENKGQTSLNQESSPCKALMPYDNLDELLNQFYVNRDNLCLFKMPPSELEEVGELKF